MFDYIVNPAPGGDYYIAVSPDAVWDCPHCKTHWEDWGKNAEDEDRPWEAETRSGIEIQSEDPDLGWCCPACAVKKATFCTLADFVQDFGLIKEAVNFALTEDGQGAIEKGYHEQLWMIFRMGFNADFSAHVREVVEQSYPAEFVGWIRGTV